MLRIVINKCYGGFGLSPEAIVWLMDRGSELIRKQTYEEYCGGDSDYARRHLLDGAKPLTGKPGLMMNSWGYAVLEPKQQVVYTVERHDDVMTFRTHPDLLLCIETLGKAANGQCADLRIVDIHDETVSIDDIYVDEYDGNEWVAQKHSTWG